MDKYRVWHTEWEEFVTDYPICINVLTGKIVKFNYGEYSGEEDIEDTKYILSKYTGLKDKNDVEIFEGDIIEEPYNSSPFRNSTLRSIEMYHGAWVARDIKEPILGDIAITRSILRGAKVIGNIYENEDLLK